MTKTLLISSFLCSVLAIGCSDKEPAATTNPMTNPTNAEDSAEESGDDTTGNVDPTNNPTNPTGATDTNMTVPGTESDVTGTPTTNPTQAETGDPTATGGDTCNFICETTGGNMGTIECDVFAQDCMGADEKCAAWAEGGGTSWNATKCVKIGGEGAAGDSCLTMDGGVSGLDDCGKGSMCWDTDDMMVGTCVELCKGTPDAPTCSEGGPCAIANDGVLNLCLPDCDPLAQDCPNANVCIPLMDAFVCVLDASGEMGAAYSPCEFANSCDPGSFCSDPTNAPMNCDPKATGCCIPFCNLDEMPACPGKNTSCKAYYEEGTAPPMKENIGACIE